MAKGGKITNVANSPSTLSRQESRKFLENHPASQNGLPKNVDRSMFGHSGSNSLARNISQGEHIAHMELSEQFMNGSAEERSSDVLAWMDELKADSSSFIESRFDELVREETRIQSQKKAVGLLIDQIFQDLRYFSYEFNKVAKGTSMQIAATILGETTEILQVNTQRQVESSATFFRARLANRHYALVLRGETDLIEFYLVPATQVMGQFMVEKQYKPVAAVAVKTQGESISWRVIDAPQPQTVEELSMELFSTFVEVTKQEVRRLED